MTPERLHEIRCTGESLALIHHGGERFGSMLLECVLTIENLQRDLAAARSCDVRPMENQA